MSGSNPLLGSTALAGQANPLGVTAPPPPLGQGPAPKRGPATPAALDHTRITGAHIAGVMRGMSQDEMLRHRDTAGNELEAMARFSAMPNLTRGEVTDYIHNLVGSGAISPVEATSILRTMPDAKGQMQAWARMMFATLMHMSSHAHAAFPIEQYPPAAAQGALQAPEQDGVPETAADAQEPPEGSAGAEEAA